MSWTRKEIFKGSVAAFFLIAFAILFLPFYTELLLAAVFAMAMESKMGRWLQPRHLRWKISVAAILVAMFTLLAVPFTYVAYRTYRYFLLLSQSGVQNSELFKKLAAFKEKLVYYVDHFTDGLNLETQFDLNAMLDEGSSRGINFLVQLSTDLAARIPSLMISIFVFVAALYYFLAEARSIKTLFMKQRLLSPAESTRLIEAIQHSCSGTVVTSIAIAALQATIVTFASLIFDAGEWAVVWAVTFFCAFIPVIGAAPVALALGIFKLVMGQPGDFVGFLVAAVVAGTADNLVRPLLISSNEEDLNPVVSLLAIIGALLLLGMPGLFLGPVIAAVAVKIVPTLYEEPTEDAKGRSKKET